MREQTEALKRLVRRHLGFGWWSLLLFLALGIVLESLHGFKVGWYLDASNETRRLMWTLAHAHGTLLSLVHLAYAVCLRIAEREHRLFPLASGCLVGSGAALPAGFFLGGVWIFSGDPGPGILLVPLGAALLLVAVLSAALGFRSVMRAENRSRR